MSKGTERDWDIKGKKRVYDLRTAHQDKKKEKKDKKRVIQEEDTGSGYGRGVSWGEGVLVCVTRRGGGSRV